MKKNKGIKHLFYAARYSWEGFRALSQETAFCHEMLLGVVALCAAWFLPHLSLLWRVFLSLLWLALPTMEILNTAIEAVVDMITEEYHPLAKKAKDLGSAAVFCTCIANLIAWLAAFSIVIRGCLQ